MPLLLLLSSGLTYFPGVLIAGLAAALPPGRSLWARITRRILVLVAVLLVVLSAVPAPIWIYALGAGAVAAWLLMLGRERPASRQRTVTALRVVVPLVALLAVASEVPYQASPRLSRAKHDPVYIIGDSLSADVAGNIQPWPALLARDHGLSVANLATAGATLKEGRRQVQRLLDEHGIVVVLLGGNDLITRRDVAQFERDLDYVLARAASVGRQVVMFELPLPPLANGYGYVQRRLAARCGVTLIPRRCLAWLLARPSATIDGLHLSSQGHAVLADLVWRCIGDACQVTPKPATNRRSPPEREAPAGVAAGRARWRFRF